MVRVAVCVVGGGLESSARVLGFVVRWSYVGKGIYSSFSSCISPLCVVILL